MLIVLVGDEDRVNPKSPKPNVACEIEIEEEKPSTSSWVAKGNKREKNVHIPKKVRDMTLQMMPGKSQYFTDMRQNYLQEKVIVADSLTDLQLATARLHDRVIQSHKFLDNDEFI